MENKEKEIGDFIKTHLPKQPNNLSHGVKLKDMLVYLEKELGWEEMGRHVKINCFTSNPSMGSSLNFLRKNSWAKNAVQDLYIEVKKERG